MKIEYDKIADALYIRFAEGAVAESEETEPGIVLDYDGAGNVVGVEILQFVKKHRKAAFPAFKAIEKAVWETEMAVA